MDWLKTTLQNNVLYIFPSRLMRLTQARRKNLRVKRLVPGKILHGPVFRAFDKPKVVVKTKHAKVARKKGTSDTSEPITNSNGVSFSLSESS